MGDYKVGEELMVKRDSSHYTGIYAGTSVKVVKVESNFYCDVKGFDGKIFSCPFSYLVKKQNFSYSVMYKKCSCGAEKTYGEKCPAYYHFKYCDKYEKRI
jgi:hypothetical protein